MSLVPFGFDGIKETVNVGSGEWLCTVSSKTIGSVSKSGNAMIAWHFTPIDPELSTDNRYWNIKYWSVLSGEGAGMFKGVLTALGENAEEYVSEKQAIYDGDGTPQDVAAFFGETVVPEMIGRTLLVRVEEEAAKDAAGAAILSNDTGEQIFNLRVKKLSRS